MRDTLFSAAIAFSLLLLTGFACNNGPENNSASQPAVQTNTDPFANAEPSGGAAEVPVGSPELLVAQLYKQHDANKGPFNQTKDRKLLDRYFTKQLADLLWRDATNPLDEIGALGADPLYNAQDVKISNLVFGKAAVEGEKAVVPVSFKNYELGQKIDFTLNLINNEWKIADINYPDGSLLKILKDTYGKPSGNAPPVKNISGEFEGTFRIGDTTCTVTPDRQAFKVRWAKGSGSEYYFYQQGNSFESEPAKNGGINRFVFDDENYNSGTFYRADGQTFPISRAK